LAALVEDPEHGIAEEEKLWHVVLLTDQGRVQKVAANMGMLAHGAVRSAASVPDKVYVGQTRGKGEGMVLHAGTAPYVPQYNDRHADSFLMSHTAKRKVSYSFPTPAMKPRRIAVVGDGTAGHVYPALAIAEAYQQLCSDINLLFIGAPEGFASQLVQNYGYRLVLVQGGPLFGIGVGGKLRTLWRLGIGFIQARQVLRATATRLVIGVGGYASAAALLAAKSLGLGTAIHEANAVAGLTNTLLSRLVDRVYLGFAAAGAAFPQGRQCVTGNPVRATIVTMGREERAAPHGSDQPFHILVTGGSLGALFLNQHIPDLLKQITERGLSIAVRHQVGGFDVDPVRAAYAHASIPAVVVPYIDDMADAYRWADFAIARAGAGTIAELAVAGIPSLLVPLPYAPGNHQVANALAFANAGGGWYVQEEDWQPAVLTEQLVSLFSDVTIWLTMSQKARRFATPNAASAIVTDCEALMAGRW
jgi:UDP-N-acetylglucosamine--N-acetylmuramyl-(pentapeptide) pyrophosphoryl-undecaprenol N-acetylglucosamine transferase